MKTGSNITITLELNVEELYTIYSALTNKTLALNEIACAKKMVKQMTGEMTGKKGKRKRRKMRGLGGLPGGLEITDELKDLIEKEL